MTPVEETLVRGTALFAAVCFAFGWPWRSSSSAESRGRIWWSIGWAASIIHVLVAFHLVHAWSHDRAVEATAKQTADLVGFGFGGGVWINYAFLGIWGADAAWRMISPPRYWSRPAWLHGTILAFLAFIVFNATVVFGGWPGRIVGIGVMLAIASQRPKACRH